MSDTKRTGLWSSLFPTRSSSCCSVKIEEITEVPPKDPETQVADPAVKSDEDASCSPRGDESDSLAPAPARGPDRR